MDIEALRQCVRGAVIAADTPGYDTARDGLLFNRRTPARRPFAIVRAQGVEDVRAAVRFAAANGITASARCSGHNWSGIAIQEGVVVDLSGLDRIAIDPAARIAEVGPGVTNRVLAETLAAQGLAFPVGHCGSVALGGYLLGGGFGWNSGSWGLGCHNVESVEMVMADGSLRHASAVENPEIFWAARGAGPAFFGIVTRFRLRLQPLPRVMKAALWTWPLDRMAEVEAAMVALAGAGIAGLEVSATMSSAPAPLCLVARKIVTLAAVVFADDADTADAALATVDLMVPPCVLDRHRPMPASFAMLYDIGDAMHPAGKRAAADCFWAATPETSFLGTLAERIDASPLPHASALAVVLPPPPGPLPDAAFSMGGAIFGAIHAVYDAPEDDATALDFVRGTSDAVADRTIGHYIGETDHDRPGRLAACFAPAAWERLATLRRRHDPTGVFARAGLGAETLRAAS